MFTQSEQEGINPERKTGDGWCDEVKEWEDGERVKVTGALLETERM